MRLPAALGRNHGTEPPSVSVGVAPSIAVYRLWNGVHQLQHLAAAGAQEPDDKHGDQDQKDQVQIVV